MKLQLIDHTFDSPEENLGCDDRLLDAGCETLRLWESPVHFVVLGRSGRVEQEVHVNACQEAAIPIVRRSSGGGTILQGPGSLNYALALSLAERPALLNVAGSYRMVLGRIARALGVAGLQVRGSDILLREKKVSGNAQRRKRGWLLHHGTILHGLDLTLMERLLLEPQRQPAHRNGRTHRQFVTGVEMNPGELKQRIISGWSEEQCAHTATSNS